MVFSSSVFFSRSASVESPGATPPIAWLCSTLSEALRIAFTRSAQVTVCCIPTSTGLSGPTAVRPSAVMQPLRASDAPTRPTAQARCLMSNSLLLGRAPAPLNAGMARLGSALGMMRLVFAAALAVAIVVGPARAQTGASGALPRAEDGYFQTPIKVTSGVWVLAQTRFQVQP